MQPVQTDTATLARTALSEQNFSIIPNQTMTKIHFQSPRCSKRPIRAWQSMLFLVILHFMAGNAAFASNDVREARKKQCPEGQYAGPVAGEKSFYLDPYIWFVSRDFAKRYCMPESYIDDSLKGALAVAVRLRPEAFTLCGMFMGRSDQCPTKQELVMDVYVDNTKAKIPKADPSVKFFIEKPHSSGWLLGPEGLPRAAQRRKGEMPDVEGERRPFSPMHSKTVNGKHWTRFFYLGVRNGWATRSGSFVETYYRADWVPGVDLITLDISYQMGYRDQRNPDLQIQTERTQVRGYPDEAHDKTNPIQRWAIGVLDGKTYAQNEDINKIAYPSGFAHVIELPHRVAQIFYAYDWKQGEQLFNSVRDAMRPNPAAKP